MEASQQRTTAPVIQDKLSKLILKLPLDSKVQGYSGILNRPVTLTLDRALGALFGVAIGDALGLPVETMTAEMIKERHGVLREYQSMPEHPYFGSIIRGEWSDDLQLTLAVCDAFSASGVFSMDEIARKQIEAIEVSDRGWGGTTRRAVQRARDGAHWSAAASPVSENAGTGNGIPMKISPLAMYFIADGTSLNDTLLASHDFSVFTHATRLGVVSGASHVAALQYCFATYPKDFSNDCFIDSVLAIAEKAEQLKEPFAWEISLTEKLRLVKEYSMRAPEDIIGAFNGGSCAVFDSLPFSYSFFLRDPHSPASFFDVINAGGDTDSNGAMVGGMLGALHGVRFWCENEPGLINNLLYGSEVFERMKLFSIGLGFKDLA